MNTKPGDKQRVFSKGKEDKREKRQKKTERRAKEITKCGCVYLWKAKCETQVKKER
jgi:hypothetical protein